MPPLHVRVCVHGRLSAAVREELPGFGVATDDGGEVLVGSVVDQAALHGLLERLHQAGLWLRDVEQVALPGRAADGALTPAPASPEAVAIQVSGRVGDCLAGLCEAVVVEDPPSTTIVARLVEHEDLFRLLSRLEALGLAIRTVHVRPEPLPEDVG